ncbi:phosphoserine phosphatase SerB [Nautilia profundicola AmH]|uniref:Phosphoserine phosphatase n=1 Tax=Nautilia profundicola (strain ATCC BAA-1463 / DSM 18972 / AmH) TaxID=598659 RepID=B9LA50_NAUPA|nr:phosphoserine phosphatase SerB [Nautilia profundicola]ACM93396.1 phosphoserine phosphatase SerB [Nautilia profundicola AmH]
MKLAVFDFDSTLMDGETIDFLAEPLGLKEKVASITEMAMRGELDFFESLIMRVKLLEGLEEKKVNEICHNLPLMPGAKDIVKELKKRNITVICFSGGFRNATSYVKDLIGLDADFSNVLHSKDGVLTGLVGGEMMFSHSKGDMLQRIQSILGVTENDTMVVGDGANDLSMFKHAKTKVAFCAKEVLKKEANIVIEEKDLTKILEFI